MVMSTKTEYIIQEESSSTFPENIIEAISYLNEVLSKVPSEFRDTATIEFESDEIYGSISNTYSVSYRRPLTAEEFSEIQRKEDLRKAARIASLEQELAAAKGL